MNSVSFVGDHGYVSFFLARLTSRKHVVKLDANRWALGEHGAWAKYQVYEVATRVPTFIHFPGIHPAIAGTTTNELYALAPPTRPLRLVLPPSAPHYPAPLRYPMYCCFQLKNLLVFCLALSWLICGPRLRRSRASRCHRPAPHSRRRSKRLCARRATPLQPC